MKHKKEAWLLLNHFSTMEVSWEIWQMGTVKNINQNGKMVASQGYCKTRASHISKKMTPRARRLLLLYIALLNVQSAFFSSLLLPHPCEVGRCYSHFENDARILKNNVQRHSVSACLGRLGAHTNPMLHPRIWTLSLSHIQKIPSHPSWIKNEVSGHFSSALKDLFTL